MLCFTGGEDTWPARCPTATRGGLPPGTQAPAHRHAEASGVTVSGIPPHAACDLGTRPPCSRPISRASWTSPPAWSIVFDCQTIIIAALFGRENYRTLAERESLDRHSMPLSSHIVNLPGVLNRPRCAHSPVFAAIPPFHSIRTWPSRPSAIRYCPTRFSGLLNPSCFT